MGFSYYAYKKNPKIPMKKLPVRLQNSVARESRAGIVTYCTHTHKYFQNLVALQKNFHKKRLNPEVIFIKRQDIPLDRKFSNLFDGIGCHSVSVG